MDKINVSFYIYPDTIEMSHFDFEFFIHQALLHDDQFFKLLLQNYSEMKEEHGKTAES